MPSVVLASSLTRWIPEAGGGPSQEIRLEVKGESLYEALAQAFERFPNLRGYVLDERGAVRHHVAVFVDGVAIARKNELGQRLNACSEVHVLQALSGG